MKFYVENWLTEEVIKVFDTEEEREEWLNENVNYFSDGGFLDDGTKICVYEGME